MAVDSTGWTRSKGHERADGLAVHAGWPGPAPPRLRQRCRPYMSHAGGWRPSAHRVGPAVLVARAKRGKRGGRKKRAKIEAVLAKAAADADPRPTEACQRTEKHNPSPADSHPLVTSSPPVVGPTVTQSRVLPWTRGQPCRDRAIPIQSLHAWGSGRLVTRKASPRFQG